MGKIKRYPPVKLIVGMITADINLFELAGQKLCERFGEIDFHSAVMPFNYTDYYNNEMGKNLQRQFISFKTLIPADRIIEAKIFTNELEEQFFFKNTQNRRINLDPGYVSASKMVLASTKDHAHRIYLGKGIFAEITLRYYQKNFQPWEWTYPDYRTKEYIDIFNQIRKIYMQQLRDSGLSAHPIVLS